MSDNTSSFFTVLDTKLCLNKWLTCPYFVPDNVLHFPFNLFFLLLNEIFI